MEILCYLRLRRFYRLLTWLVRDTNLLRQLRRLRSQAMVDHRDRMTRSAKRIN